MLNEFKPMLAESSPKPFDSQDYLTELKLDGVRCLAELDGKTSLYGRNLSGITAKFPELMEIHTKALKPCVLDGEIVSADLKFSHIQERIHRINPLAIRIASKVCPSIFYAFDILSLEGKDLTGLPLTERKISLSNNIFNDCAIRKLDWQIGHAIEFFDQVARVGMEGIMAKLLTSTYQAGRSPDWLKIKAFKEGVFYAVGITKGEGERTETFGSLVLAEMTDGNFSYVGNAGSGLGRAMLRRVLSRVVEVKSPFNKMPDLDRELLCWIKPIGVEIRYLEKSEEGKLRFPTFRGLVE